MLNHNHYIIIILLYMMNLRLYRRMRLVALFYIPLFYLFRTRPHAVISLFFTYLQPIVFLYCLQWGFTGQTLLLSLSVLLIVETVYEIGYIQNDTETIRKEKNPTMRINKAELGFYHRHRVGVYASHILLTGLFLSVLRIIVPNADLLSFGIGLAALLMTFLSYNSFRGHITMLLYFILSSLRHIVPFLLFPENISFALVVLLLMTNPFPRTLEFKSSKLPHVTTNIYFWKYIIRYDTSRLFGFRVIAYFVLCLVAAVLYEMSFFPSPEYLYIMLYILMFRGIIYMYYRIRGL